MAPPALPRIDPEQDGYLDEVIAIVRGCLAGVPCTAWLFGSRATGRSVPWSDIDIAIECSEDIGDQLSLARERLEESNVPLFVDLVDLRDAPETLRRDVNEEGILLWRHP